MIRIGIIGTGLIARGRDIQSFGYEPSAERRSRASQDGFEVLNSLDKVAEVGWFDLLICTETLEHVPDPRNVLRFLRKHARLGALLAITVPQCDHVLLLIPLKLFSGTVSSRESSILGTSELFFD